MCSSSVVSPVPRTKRHSNNYKGGSKKYPMDIEDTQHVKMHMFLKKIIIRGLTFMAFYFHSLRHRTHKAY